MFRKPRLLAHIAYGFALLAMIWVCAVELFDLNITILNWVAVLFFCAGVLFSILTLVFNRRVPKENRIKTIGIVEVIMGIMFVLCMLIGLVSALILHLTGG